MNSYLGSHECPDLGGCFDVWTWHKTTAEESTRTIVTATATILFWMESKQMFLSTIQTKSFWSVIKKWLIKSTRNEKIERERQTSPWNLKLFQRGATASYITLISISYASIHTHSHTCPTSSRGSLEVSDSNNWKPNHTNESTNNLSTIYRWKIMIASSFAHWMGIRSDDRFFRQHWATYPSETMSSSARTAVSSSPVINSFLSVRKTASIHSHNTFRFYNRMRSVVLLIDEIYDFFLSNRESSILIVLDFNRF